MRVYLLFDVDVDSEGAVVEGVFASLGLAMRHAQAVDPERIRWQTGEHRADAEGWHVRMERVGDAEPAGPYREHLTAQPAEDR